MSIQDPQIPEGFVPVESQIPEGFVPIESSVPEGFAPIESNPITPTFKADLGASLKLGFRVPTNQGDAFKRIPQGFMGVEAKPLDPIEGSLKAIGDVESEWIKLPPIEKDEKAFRSPDKQELNDKIKNLNSELQFYAARLDSAQREVMKEEIDRKSVSEEVKAAMRRTLRPDRTPYVSDEDLRQAELVGSANEENLAEDINTGVTKALRGSVWNVVTTPYELAHVGNIDRIASDLAATYSGIDAPVADKKELVRNIMGFKQDITGQTVQGITQFASIIPEVALTRRYVGAAGMKEIVGLSRMNSLRAKAVNNIVKASKGAVDFGLSQMWAKGQTAPSEVKHNVEAALIYHGADRGFANLYNLAFARTMLNHPGMTAKMVNAFFKTSGSGVTFAGASAGMNGDLTPEGIVRELPLGLSFAILGNGGLFKTENYVKDMSDVAVREGYIKPENKGFYEEGLTAALSDKTIMKNFQEAVSMSKNIEKVKRASEADIDPNAEFPLKDLAENVEKKETKKPKEERDVKREGTNPDAESLIKGLEARETGIRNEADLKQFRDDIAKSITDRFKTEDAIDVGNAIKGNEKLIKEVEDLVKFFEKEFNAEQTMMNSYKTQLAREIYQSATETGAFAKKAPITEDALPIGLPEETLLQKGQRKLQDKLNRSEQMVEIGKQVKQIPEEADFARKGELWSRKASGEINEFESKIINGKDGIMDRLEKSGISADDFGDYLYAKHAPEVNAYVKTLNDVNIKGSGMTDAEAAKIVKELGTPEMESFAKEFYDTVTKPALQMRKDFGLMDAETYNKLSGFYQNYVPLKGNAKEKIGRTFGGKGVSITNRGMMRRKGRSSEANNPFIQAVMDYEDAVVLKHKNLVGKAVLKFIDQFPDVVNKDGQKLWNVRSQQFIPSYNKFGEIEFMNKRYKVEDNELSVWVDGKQKIIEINDDALVRGLKNLGTERGFRLLNNFNNYLRYVNTLGNPEFAIGNLPRDIQAGLINIQPERIEGITRRVIKDIPSSLRQIWRMERGKDSPLIEQYKDFELAGGKTGWLTQKSFEQKAKEFENKIKDYHRANMFQKAFGESLKFVEDLNEAVENGTRFAVYRALIEKGVSKDKAGSVAANMTVNFNKKGEWGDLMNSLYLFSNAGVQGNAILLKSMKNPRVQKIVAGIAGMSMMGNYINRQINEEEFEKIDEYVRDTNWIFMLPDGKHLKIAMPYGYNVFAVAGNVAADQVYGKEGIGNSSKRIMSSILDAFNPLGRSGALSTMLAPTAVRPLIEISENVNFAGKPIRKDQPAYQPKVPESSLYFKGVNPYTKAFTDWLNESTGGMQGENKKGEEVALTSGLVDLNPENIDHMIDFLGGGLGRLMNNSFNMSHSLLTEGQLPDVRQFPFVRRVVGSTREGYNSQKAYQMLSESGRNVMTPDERSQFKKLTDDALKNGEIDQEDYDRMNQMFDRAQQKLLPDSEIDHKEFKRRRDQEKKKLKNSN